MPQLFSRHSIDSNHGGANFTLEGQDFHRSDKEGYSMPRPDAKPSLPIEERKRVFLALVAAQDGGMAVAKSWKAVAKQFSSSEPQVRRIEQEGLDGEWPPLR
jgi:hypothetical protein